jgi:hypothetical protein
VVEPTVDVPPRRSPLLVLVRSQEASSRLCGALLGIPQINDVLSMRGGRNGAQRPREDQADRAPRAVAQRRARDATKGLSVTRLADGAGVVCFARSS